MNPKKAFSNYFGNKVDVKVAGNGKENYNSFSVEEDLRRIIKLIKG
jgi:ParB family chromosome partitioning protein